MAEIIDRELDGVAVYDYAAVGDAVGVAADGCSEVALVVLGEIGADAVEAEHHVAELAVAVGHHHRDDAAAVVGDAYLHAGGVLKRVEAHLLAVNLRGELLRVEAGGCGLGLLLCRASGRDE